MKNLTENLQAIRNLIITTLETQNYRYHVAENGEAAIMEAVTSKPDTIILDLGLPDIDGVEIIKK